MIVFVLGYFVMGLIFLVLRFIYHVVSKNNLIPALKNDLAELYAYDREIILSNPVKIKIIGVVILIFIVSLLMPLEIETLSLLDCIFSTIIYFFMVIIYAPQKNPTSKEFPIEIFGFIYSIVLMYASAGEFVIDFFETDNYFNDDVWIYGYCVVLVSYVICIATLSNFMERNLSRLEIIFVGMIMMTVLEFMTYYGVGFCGGMEYYDPKIFENSILEGIMAIINQGIFIASQSQILERSTKEICGYIILNGTDVLTVTAVLGYVLQRFMENDDTTKH